MPEYAPRRSRHRLLVSQLASLLASLLLLTACGPPIDDDAVVVGTLKIRDEGEGSIALWQEPKLRAELLCNEAGFVVVRYLAEYDGSISISPDEIELDGLGWPHTVSVEVNGEAFELEDGGVFVTLNDSDPDDESAGMSDIELRGTSSDPALLHAINETGWIQVRAMGAAYAGEFSEDELAPLIDTCERFTLASRNAPTPEEMPQFESQQMGGSWTGEYHERAEANGQEVVVPFRLELTNDGDHFNGRSAEGEEWVLRGAQPLTAQITGSVDGTRVRFEKLYDAESFRSGTLVYEGTFSADQPSVTGTWQLPGRSGTFQMRRE